jgi:hypothetical protein
MVAARISGRFLMVAALCCGAFNGAGCGRVAASAPSEPDAMATDGSSEDGLDSAPVESATPDTGSETGADAGGDCLADCWVPIGVGGLHWRVDAAAVWTEHSLVIVGGRYSQGFDEYCATDSGSYDPTIDLWAVFDGGVCNKGRTRGVWTGKQVLVPDIHFMSALDLSTKTWSKTKLLANHSVGSAVVWTGQVALTWGADLGGGELCGVAYDPTTGSAQDLVPPNPSFCGRWQSVVWAGDRMIVWGGWSGSTGTTGTNAGLTYNPISGSWTPMSTVGAPSPRLGAPAVWTGSEMIVWGGHDSGADHANLYDGAKYDPVSESWQPIATLPDEGTDSQNAVWADGRMMVWLGNAGWMYDPDRDEWTRMNPDGAPQDAERAAIAWTGSEFIVWGGGRHESEGAHARYRPPPKGQ